MTLRAKDGSFWAEGSAPTMYGAWRLDAAGRAGHLYIAEGETNCWAGWLRGLPVLGAPGAAMSGKLLAEHVEAVEAVYVLKDPDAGGAALAEGVARRLGDLGWRGEAFAVRLPTKDLADLHAAHPNDAAFFLALRQAVESAQPLHRAATAAAELRRFWPTLRPIAARWLADDLHRAHGAGLDALAADLAPLVAELHAPSDGGKGVGR